MHAASANRRRAKDAARKLHEFPQFGHSLGTIAQTEYNPDKQNLLKSCEWMVRKGGVEPPRSFGAVDFESTASAIPPLPRGSFHSNMTAPSPQTRRCQNRLR